MREGLSITEMRPEHRSVVIAHVLEEWGDPIISKGQAVHARDLPGLVAEREGQAVGALLYSIQGDALEIVVLFALAQGEGTGSALIAAAVELARARGCRRVWLITTNDNTPAMRFYQRLGFSLAAAHIDAFEVTKRMKRPPLTGTVPGIDGIPIRHEMEFEMWV